MVIMYVSLGFRVICVQRGIPHIIRCVPRSITYPNTHTYVCFCVIHVAERLCLTVLTLSTSLPASPPRVCQSPEWVYMCVVTVILTEA